MEQPSTVEKLARQYERQPVLRGLIQLIPFGVGSAIDALLLTQLQNIREERTRAFFDELSSGKIELKPELLKSEDFLHCYFSTVSAALNSRRREKIRMFARLLKSVILPDSFSGTDEYEEYLGILDELSYRELLILFTLDKYESKFPKNVGENDLQRAVRFCGQFTDELEKTLGLPKNEIDAILTRLNRTGCYETFIGGYYNYTGGKGKLTPTFFRLKKLIESEGGEFAQQAV